LVKLPFATASSALYIYAFICIYVTYKYILYIYKHSSIQWNRRLLRHRPHYIYTYLYVHMSRISSVYICYIYKHSSIPWNSRLLRHLPHSYICIYVYMSRILRTYISYMSRLSLHIYHIYHMYVNTYLFGEKLPLATAPFLLYIHVFICVYVTYITYTYISWICKYLSIRQNCRLLRHRSHCIYMYVCIYICMYVYTYIYVTYITYIYISYMNKYSCIRRNCRSLRHRPYYIYIYMYIHIYIYMYTHIHIHLSRTYTYRNMYMRISDIYSCGHFWRQAIWWVDI